MVVVSGTVVSSISKLSQGGSRVCSSKGESHFFTSREESRLSLGWMVKAFSSIRLRRVKAMCFAGGLCGFFASGCG